MAARFEKANTRLLRNRLTLRTGNSVCDSRIRKWIKPAVPHNASSQAQRPLSRFEAPQISSIIAAA